jgi:uncharacterized protein YecT (DUF1311 family)
MNDCTCDRYKKSDSLLNVTYKKILKEYAQDKLFLKKLKAAQVAWIALRNADEAAIYPDTAWDAYGSSHPMCRCDLLRTFTEERTKFLQRWLDGKEEGDPCGGSVRTK